MRVARLFTNKVVGEGLSRETAEALARDVLSSPVTEDCRAEVEA